MEIYKELCKNNMDMKVYKPLELEAPKMIFLDFHKLDTMICPECGRKIRLEKSPDFPKDLKYNYGKVISPESTSVLRWDRLEAIAEPGQHMKAVWFDCPECGKMKADGFDIRLQSLNLKRPQKLMTYTKSLSLYEGKFKDRPGHKIGFQMNQIKICLLPKAEHIFKLTETESVSFDIEKKLINISPMHPLSKKLKKKEPILDHASNYLERLDNAFLSSPYYCNDENGNQQKELFTEVLRLFRDNGAVTETDETKLKAAITYRPDKFLSEAAKAIRFKKTINDAFFMSVILPGHGYAYEKSANRKSAANIRKILNTETLDLIRTCRFPLSKKLKRMLIKYPSMVLFINMLYGAGIKDINNIYRITDSMTERLDNEKNRYYIQRIYSCLLERKHRDCIRLLIAENGEKQITDAFVPSMDRKHFNNETLFDICRIYKDIIGYPDASLIGPDGISMMKGSLKAVHDRLSDYSGTLMYGNYALSFNEPVAKNLPFTENEYTVRYPKDTAEMRKIGRDMHICVGSYANDVLAKKTVVMCVTDASDKYQGCIEIDNRYKKLKQIKAFANSTPKGGLASFINDWIKAKGLDIKDTYDYSLMKKKLKCAENIA